MRKSKIVFKMSDIMFHYPRNYKRFPKVIREKDIVYDTRYGNYTKADIYYNPDKRKSKYPIFVNIHGGGFVKGDKRHRITFCSSLAEKGWFVFNINHRLAPDYPLPAGIEDTINALNYILKLKDKYDLDTDKIVVSGDSAGAYYAVAAVASIYNENLLKKLELPSFNGKIAALVSFCGLFDLKKALSKPAPFGISKDIAECLTGMELKDDLSNIDDFKYKEALSILDFVNNEWPPTFIVMAENDSFCGGQGEILEEKLKEKGVKVSSYNANKYGEFHCFHLLPFLKSAKVCMEQVMNYLDTIKE